MPALYDCIVFIARKVAGFGDSNVKLTASQSLKLLNVLPCRFI